MFAIIPLKEPVRENAKKLKPVLENIDPRLFDRVGTVHFARFLLIEEKIPGKTSDPRFAFISTYDGEFRPYVQDFVDCMGDVIDEISQYLDVPDGITPVKKHAKALGDLFLEVNQDVPFWYSAYPHLTVLQIKADALTQH